MVSFTIQLSQKRRYRASVAAASVVFVAFVACATAARLLGCSAARLPGCPAARLLVTAASLRLVTAAHFSANQGQLNIHHTPRHARTE
jgi:hypothetical protein